MMKWVKILFLIFCICLVGVVVVANEAKGNELDSIGVIFALGVILSLAAIVIILVNAFLSAVKSVISRIFSRNAASTASSAGRANNRSRGIEAANGRRRIVENGSDVRNTAPQLSDNDSIIGHRRLDL